MNDRDVSNRSKMKQKEQTIKEKMVCFFVWYRKLCIKI